MRLGRAGHSACAPCSTTAFVEATTRRRKRTARPIAPPVPRRAASRRFSRHRTRRDGPRGEDSAAAWITTSNWPRSGTGRDKSWLTAASAAPGRGGRREGPVTRWPSRRRYRPTGLPTNPLLPVTGISVRPRHTSVRASGSGTRGGCAFAGADASRNAEGDRLPASGVSRRRWPLRVRLRGTTKWRVSRCRDEDGARLPARSAAQATRTGPMQADGASFPAGLARPPAG